jgi:uncharacterized membrane protein required for colicin V production
MLMVTPASFEDILAGKLLVVLVYQLVLTGVVLVILGAFTGQIALVLLYALLGSCFSLALGLLLGAVFNTVSAATAVAAMIWLASAPLGDPVRGYPGANFAWANNLKEAAPKSKKAIPSWRQRFSLRDPIFA